MGGGRVEINSQLTLFPSQEKSSFKNSALLGLKSISLLM